MSTVQSKWVLGIGVLAVIATAVLYGPLLRTPFQVSANDQLWFFSEMNHAQTAKAKLLILWDHCANRYYETGDTFLFRPLYIVWLFIWYQLFSYHYLLWNLLSFCLHLLNLFLLYRFLKDWGPPLAAVVGTFAFTVMPTAGYLVTNHHWSGYLLAVSLLLIALHEMAPLAEERSFNSGRLVRYLAVLTAGAFIHEMLAVFCVLMAGFILWNRRRKYQEWDPGRVFVLLLPLIIYLTVYSLRTLALKRPVIFTEEIQVSGLFSWERLEMVLNMLWADMRAYGRILFPPPLSALGAGAIVSLSVYLLRHGLNLTFLKRRLPFISAVSLMAISYNFILTFFRLTCIGRGHYCYLGCLLFLIWGYSLVDWGQFSGRRLILPGTWIVLLIFILFFQTWINPRTFLIYDKGADHYFSALNHYVDRHKHEKSFSFQIENPLELWDTTTSMRIGYDGEGKGYVTQRVSEIIYAPYLSNQVPRDLVSFDARGRLTVKRTGEAVS